MNKKIDYLDNYKTNTLYINDSHQDGKYLTVVNGKILVECEISPQIKLAIKAFYANQKNDITHYEIIKFKKGNEEEKVSLSSFGLAKVLEFNKLIEGLDIKNSSSQTISLQKINLSSIQSILGSDNSMDFLKALENDPNLTNDVIALHHRKEELKEFKKKLSESTSEPDWQKFFEKNNWIFGYGLNYIFASNVKDYKMEQIVVGANFNEKGKRTDSLMRTKAEISQYVLVEIKKSDTELLLKESYRSGCWQPSSDLSGAVIQIQKTAFEFIKNSTNFSDKIKNQKGDFTGEEIYKIMPKTYVVCGSLKSISQNEDKIKCFEMYRNSLSYPEIITYDELYQRAECIIETLEKKGKST